MNEPTGFERLRRFGVASWSIAGAVVLLAMLLWLVYQVRILWPPLVLAGAVLYLLSPLVDRLQQWRIHRAIGSCLAYLLFAGLLVLVGFIVVPVISDQFAEFADRLPEITDDVSVFLVDLGDRLGFSLGEAAPLDNVQQWLADFFDQDRVEQMLGQLGEFARTGFEVMVVLALGPVLAFYILVDLPGFQERARRLIPDRARAEVLHVVSQLGRVVGGFVRGQLLVAVIVGVLSSLGLWLLKVPFWLIIGMVAGLLNIVPFIGPLVGGFLAALVSVVFVDFTTALWSVVMFTAVQQFDNHVVSPNILKSRVQLNPVFILLALLLGGSIGGFFGLLIAVPTVASVRVVLGHLWRTKVLGESWEEAAGAMITEYEPPLREGIVARLRRGGEVPAQDRTDQGEDHGEQEGAG